MRTSWQRCRGRIAAFLAAVAILFAHGLALADPQAFAIDVPHLGRLVLIGEDGADAVKRYIDGLIRREAFPKQKDALRAWGKQMAAASKDAPTVASLREGGVPIVGIQLGYPSDLLGDSGAKKTRRNYKRAIAKAGGMPMFLPPAASQRQINATIDALDHVLLAGGQDIHPSLYGQDVTHANAGDLNLVRDRYERRFTLTALKKGIGLDGICRGCQMLNVAHGGTLHQDLLLDGVTDQAHVKPGFQPLHHPIGVVEDSQLKDTVGTTKLRSAVSLHHQAIDKVAPGFKVVAVAPDGVKEGLEGTSAKTKNARCYQFHPERSPRAKFGQAIFKDMIGRAKGYAAARR